MPDRWRWRQALRRRAMPFDAAPDDLAEAGLINQAARLDGARGRRRLEIAAVDGGAHRWNRPQRTRQRIRDVPARSR